jgi:hypothetical protein
MAGLSGLTRSSPGVATDPRTRVVPITQSPVAATTGGPAAALSGAAQATGGRDRAAGPDDRGKRWWRLPNSHGIAGGATGLSRSMRPAARSPRLLEPCGSIGAGCRGCWTARLRKEEEADGQGLLPRTRGARTGGWGWDAARYAAAASAPRSRSGEIGLPAVGGDLDAALNPFVERERVAMKRRELGGEHRAETFPDGRSEGFRPPGGGRRACGPCDRCRGCWWG